MLAQSRQSRWDQPNSVECRETPCHPPYGQAGVLRAQSPACLLSSCGDGQLCAFAKAVGTQENGAVVLGLRRAALTRSYKRIRLT